MNPKEFGLNDEDEDMFAGIGCYYVSVTCNQSVTRSVSLKHINLTMFEF